MVPIINKWLERSEQIQKTIQITMDNLYTILTYK